MKTAKEETREKLLQSAMKEFAANGYAKTNIDDISVHAGFGKGTIYNYFPSKVELFLEVIRRFINNLVSDINDSIKDINDPIEKFIEVVRVDVQAISSNSDLFLTIIHESLTADRDRQREFLDASSPLFLLYVQVIDEGIKAGYYNDDTDPLSSAIMVMAMVENLVTINNLLNDSVGPTEDLVQKITTTFIYGMKKRSV